MKQPMDQLIATLEKTFEGVVQIRTSVTIRNKELQIIRPADPKLQNYLRFEHVGWLGTMFGTYRWPTQTDIDAKKYIDLYKWEFGMSGYRRYIDIDAFKPNEERKLKFIKADDGEYFVNKNHLGIDEMTKLLTLLLALHNKKKG